MSTYIETLKRGNDEIAPRTKIDAVENLTATLASKQDAVSGKGLSTNDYTTAEKNKLAGIAEGATANTGTVTSVAVKMNGSVKGTVTTSGTIDIGTVLTQHQNISGKEDTSNKVTAISSTSTDTQYPSAKATYDAVESAKDIFWCTYGTTAYADIISAINAGKYVVCIDGEIILPFTRTINTTLYFGNIYGAAYSKGVSLTSTDVWSRSGKTLETTSNKATSISASSTDTQYPSAKCVYDQLITKQSVISSSNKISADFIDDSATTNKFVESADITNWNNVYSKVPAQTYTSGNELADKTFVNSSIATNTANFLGTLDVVTDLGLSYGAATSAVVSALNSHTFSATKTNNDYTFVINKDSDDHFIYQRYKWVTDNSTFAYEYTLNNSSFTANQWSAINSGITSTIVSDIASKTWVGQQGYLTQHQSLATCLKNNENGTLTGNSSDTPLYLRSCSTSAYLGFKNNSGTTLGYVGVNSSNKPVFYDTKDNQIAFTSDIPTSDISANTAARHTHSNMEILSTVTVAEQVRKITISTSDPSGGSDGDIWLKYNA